MAVVSLLAFAGACGGDSGPTGGGSNTAVTVGNNVFSPNSSTVPVGTAITWTWGAGAASHNVTFDDGPTSTTQSSGTYLRTFTVAGTFPYHCTVHGASMSGTVIVQ